MDLEILLKVNYERWRNGQVPYLEKVCNINLKKLSTILHEMRVYAKNIRNGRLRKRTGKGKSLLLNYGLAKTVLKILKNGMPLTL